MPLNKYIVTLAILKRHGLTNQNADEQLLSASLTRAQTIDLVSATCQDFVDDFLSKNGVYNPTERAIIDDYVIPFLAVCIDIRAVEALSNRVNNAGLSRPNGMDVQRNNEEDRRLFINSLRADKMILAERLRKAVESYCVGCGDKGHKDSYPQIVTL